jgi:hypothetical protein
MSVSVKQPSTFDPPAVVCRADDLASPPTAVGQRKEEDAFTLMRGADLCRRRESRRHSETHCAKLRSHGLVSQPKVP